MEFIVGFVVWLLFCALVGKWAASKGRSAGFWFFASFLLSPLIGGLIVALSPKIGAAALPRDAAGEAMTDATHTRCPDCRELVRKDARKCKHCSTALVPQ